RVDLNLDDLEVLLAQLEQVDELVLRDLMLDQGEQARGRADRRRDAEQVEMCLVAGIVDARDDLGNPVLLARELADDDVVLVVAGSGDDDVRRTRDAGALEHGQLRGIADLRLMLELLLESLESLATLLDERDLVPHV